MELVHLRSFIQIAESGSMTRAAENLFLTQPAVTQHIQALENEFGTKLFNRHPRGMHLTQAGTILRTYAQNCLATLEDCRLAISELEAGQRGQVIIGAGVTTSIFVLPDWLRVFRAKYPAVEMILRTGRSQEIMMLLKEGEIDMGIITTPAENPHFTMQRLFDEDIILVAPFEHPFAGTNILAERLAEIPLILFPHGNGFRSYLDQALAQACIPVTIKMETDSVEAIKRFVEAGLGASFLPRSAVQEELTHGTLAAVGLINLAPLQRTTYLAYLTNRYQTFGMRHFLQLLTDWRAHNTSISTPLR